MTEASPPARGESPRCQWEQTRPKQDSPNEFPQTGSPQTGSPQTEPQGLAAGTGTHLICGGGRACAPPRHELGASRSEWTSPPGTCPPGPDTLEERGDTGPSGGTGGGGHGRCHHVLQPRCIPPSTAAPRAAVPPASPLGKAWFGSQVLPAAGRERPFPSVTMDTPNTRTAADRQRCTHAIPREKCRPRPSAPPAPRRPARYWVVPGGRSDQPRIRPTLPTRGPVCLKGVGTNWHPAGARSLRYLPGRCSSEP